MRVLPLDTASLTTPSRSATDSPMQQLPNSFPQPEAPEVHRPDVSEQHPPSLRLSARKKAVNDVTSRANRTQLLSGWKEIANYMHRGVRTVQRWESMGLPVRRVKNSRPAPVIAFAEDLDAWARSLHVPLIDTIEELRATISSLEAQIRSLKRQLRARNHPAHMEKTRTARALRQLSPDYASQLSPRCRSNNPSRPPLTNANGELA